MLKVFLESAKQFLTTVVSQSFYDSLLPLTIKAVASGWGRGVGLQGGQGGAAASPGPVESNKSSL